VLSRSKERYSEAARSAGMPAIISGGIYPGTSNVMAAHIIGIARKEYDENWNYRQRAPGGDEFLS
jgi:saccharopine dehydrogenase-like NADP-dependent oxidoreductase